MKENCTYIDEKDENSNLIINKFGEVVFDIGEDYDVNNRMIRIDMKLGGTYIYASAIYLKNGKKNKNNTNICLDFYNRKSSNKIQINDIY